MLIIHLAHEKSAKYGALVKRSRRRPLTAESRVRFPDALPRTGVTGLRFFFYSKTVSIIMLTRLSSGNIVIVGFPTFDNVEEVNYGGNN